MKRFAYLLFLFCVLLSVRSAGAQTPAGKPQIKIEQEVYDAGVFYRTGEKIEHAFVIKNAGTSDLNIYSATPG